MKEIAPSHLSKYFMQKGDVFVVNDLIKAMCQFDKENVFDAAIETVDLVSCRNLLIYFKGPLQDQLISIFHQCLVANGLLFLGQSESLSASRHHLFKPLDLNHRLYVHR
jgi:two-component system CheB/CheR fusion protein